MDKLHTWTLWREISLSGGEFLIFDGPLAVFRGLRIWGPHRYRKMPVYG